MRAQFLTAMCVFTGVGCDFPRPPDVPTDAADASTAADASKVADGPTACVVGFLDVCDEAPPTDAFVVTADIAINTDGDSRCRARVIDGAPICLVYVTDFQVAQGTTLTATGNSALAVVSTGGASIGGTVDASSYRNLAQLGAGPAACVFRGRGSDDLSGGGGGAGGSFFGVGGVGGTGDANDNGSGKAEGAPPADVITTLTSLRGGCAGTPGGTGSQAGGTSGAGGGAVYIASRQMIAVSGIIRATGAGGGGGGVQGGGGGGGSGGAIVLEAPVIMLTSTGKISANGGGGGEGGGAAVAQPGGDGNIEAIPALGGASVGGSPDSNGGDGGSGSAGATAAGSGGVDDNAGAGGGGGGAGIVWVRSPIRELRAGAISPPPVTRE